MRLESQEHQDQQARLADLEATAEPATVEAGTRAAREAANRWLARFAPLLEGQDELTATECRRRLKVAAELVAQGREVLAGLEAVEPTGPLVTTLRAAVPEAETLEGGLRRRLARLSPGDPAGEVDLEAIQARLAESAARREVGELTGAPVLTPYLQLKTSPANWGAAAGLGVFGLGWNAFTTIHAILFIGGFWRAIGPFALFFLLFYAIFWGVGFAMLYGAFLSGCNEELEIDGRTLVLTRKLGPFTWRREAVLGPRSRARRVAAAVSAGKNSQPGRTGTDVAIRDENDREIRFASMRNADEQERLVARLNDYLAGLE